MENYQILLTKETFDKIEQYKSEMLAKPNIAGRYLQSALKDKDLLNLSTKEFLDILLNTRPHLLFAESDIDPLENPPTFTKKELQLQGGISVNVPVTVYDNGLWNNPEIFNDTFEANLIFVAGPLLTFNSGEKYAPDYYIIENGKINQDRYNKLIEERLLPGLIQANNESEGNDVVITMPGIGLGQFAGKWRDTEELHNAFITSLKTLITKYVSKLPNIKKVYIDTFAAILEPSKTPIEHIEFKINPSLCNNNPIPLLSKPESHFPGNNGNYKLYKIVAWDHASWPGNDFFHNARSTDDGVSAASTNLMTKLSGIEGQYDKTSNKYLPKDNNHGKRWINFFKENHIKLQIDNLFVIDENGKYLDIPTPVIHPTITNKTADKEIDKKSLDTSTPVNHTIIPDKTDKKIIADKTTDKKNLFIAGGCGFGLGLIITTVVFADYLRKDSSFICNTILQNLTPSAQLKILIPTTVLITILTTIISIGIAYAIEKNSSNILSHH